MGSPLPFNPFDGREVPEALHFLILEEGCEEAIMNLFDTHGQKDQIVSTFFNFLRDCDHKKPLDPEAGPVRWVQPRLPILKAYVKQVRDQARARGLDAVAPPSASPSRSTGYYSGPAGSAPPSSGTPSRAPSERGGPPPGSAQTSYSGRGQAGGSVASYPVDPSQASVPPSSHGGGPDIAGGGGGGGGEAMPSGMEDFAALAGAGELEEELAGVRREKADLLAKCRLALERIEHLDTLERDLCEEIAKARIQHLVRGLGRGIFNSAEA